MAEKIPPHNQDAERSVLGAAMLSKEAIFDIVEVVSAEDFYEGRHKSIYEAIIHLYKSGHAVDIVTVCDELKKQGILSKVGGRAYISSLCADLPSFTNAGQYAKIVSEKASLRKLISVSEEIKGKSFEEGTPAESILEYAERHIYEIAQDKQTKDFVHIEDVLASNMDNLDKIMANGGEVVGLPTGYKRLDQITSGLHPSDLIVLAARPAMGKTAFALNIALHAAVKEKATVLIFSLEMSKEQLGERLMSMESSVEMQKLRTGQLNTSDDWPKLHMALDSLSKSNLHIDDTPGITVLEMKNKCRRLKAEKGLDLVVIDYLQLMRMEGRSENRQQEVSAMSRYLKLLAREMECPVIVLSQLSRGPEQRQDKRPILSDLRESGSIEQDADMVILLYRDDYYYKDSKMPGTCEVNIAKHRNGATDKIFLAFIQRYTKFGELTSELEASYSALAQANIE